MRIAVYPGSFDPITLGHLDIIERSAKLFDRVIVAVMINPGKKPMFDPQERVELIQKSLKSDNVEVAYHDGLLIDFVHQKGANVIVKGLRAISDFEAEFQMASANQKLDATIDTVFIMTRVEYMYLSSSIVKEVARFGGDVSGFVSEPVWRAIKEKSDDRTIQD